MTRSLVPLAFADEQFAAGEVEVFHPQAEALEQPQAGAAHQPGHEAVRVVRLAEDEPPFGLGQDDWQTGRPLGADRAGDDSGVSVKDVSVQK